MAKTVKFIFLNVVYIPTVYKTGVWIKPAQLNPTQRPESCFHLAKNAVNEGQSLPALLMIVRTNNGP